VRFRLIATTGHVLDEGDGTCEVTDGVLVVAPDHGDVLRVAPSDVAAVQEPEPFVVRLELHEGPALELSGLGRMRTQILAQLADARGAEVAGTLMLAGVGMAESFSGEVDARDAELRLYDDSLVVVRTDGGGEKVPYPFVRSVERDASGYRLTVSVAGREPLIVARLARRTGEFADLLVSRQRAAAGRTAAFLGALLPGLGPVALRSVSGLLRDGVAAPRADLDALDPTIWPALIGAAAVPDRLGGIEHLSRLGPVWLGFTQVVSVEREAEGVTPWRDSATTPNLGSHDGHAGSFGSGFAGMLGAELVAGGLDAPFGAYGAALAYSVLGRSGGFGGGFPGSGFPGSGFPGSGFGGGGFPGSAGGFGGSGFGGSHVPQPRADVTRDRLTPAHTDHAALAAGGPEPTVRAFVLCHAGGRVAYEVLNEGDHATYVFHAADPDDVIAVNRALSLVGFRVAGILDDADSAGSRYRKAARRLPALRLLRDAYAGRAIHHDNWASDLQALLTA
jgi:hypothetical protein